MDQVLRREFEIILGIIERGVLIKRNICVYISFNYDPIYLL